MLKNHSSDALVKITHDKPLENIDFKDQIKILDSMIDHPKRMSRKVYQAKKFYDDKGNFNSEHWEYQLPGTLYLVGIPVGVAVIAGTIGSIKKDTPIHQDLALTTTTIIGAGALTIAATNAYMSQKGSHMAEEIKQEIITNLERNGYEIDLPKVETNHFDFSKEIMELIRKASICQYPSYELDIERLKKIHQTWISIYSNLLAIKGSKPQIPRELMEKYSYLKRFINHKIKLYRYEDNNQKLLTQERIGNIKSKYISLAEEDPFILEASKLIEEILYYNYEGYERELNLVRSISIEWIAKNVKSYRDTGKKLPIEEAPYNMLERFTRRVRRKITASENSREFKRKTK